jgi:uncharacterized protein YlbG (UPF0298 family)
MGNKIRQDCKMWKLKHFHFLKEVEQSIIIKIINLSLQKINFLLLFLNKADIFVLVIFFRLL